MAEDREADAPHCQCGAQGLGHRQTQVAPLRESRVASPWDRAPIPPPTGVYPGLTRSTGAPVTVAKGEGPDVLQLPADEPTVAQPHSSTLSGPKRE